MTKENLFEDMVHTVLKFYLSSGFIQSTVGKEPNQIEFVNINVEIPAILVEAMKVAIGMINNESLTQSFCRSALYEHCSRYELEPPDKFVFPQFASKVTDPLFLLEKIIKRHLWETLILNIGDEITDQQKYNDSLDLLGSMIMALTKSYKDKGLGEGDHTKH